MCIFSGPVETVSNTKICVGTMATPAEFQISKTAPEKLHQFTVYGNSVSFHGKNVAMILPCPVNPLLANGGIKVYDMSKKTRVFVKLDNLFPKPRSMTLSYDAFASTNSAETLKVFKSGNYSVTIVPDFTKFKNLDWSAFSLNPDVVRLLENKYATNYGFVVCRLQPDAKYEPIAYSHPIMIAERQILLDGSKQKQMIYFVPTKHFHNDANELPDWDHTVYVLDKYPGVLAERGVRTECVYKHQLEGRSVRDLKAQLPDNACVDVVSVDKIKIDSMFKQNIDLHFGIVSH